MQNHDDDFIQRFEAGDIQAGTFDHRAHVRLAWSYLSQYGVLEAMARFVAALRDFVRRVGAEGKYHETITVAFLLLIAERIEVGESWSAFEARNADLIERGAELLGQHYSADALSATDARQRFVLPDRRLA